MKKLLVLGNGFDLHCRLNSTFNHFLTFSKSEKDPKGLNFFLYVLWLTFFEESQDELAQEHWQKELNISEKDNWMDFELMLNHLLFESTNFYDLAKKAYEYRWYGTGPTRVDDIYAKLKVYFKLNVKDSVSFEDYLRRQLDDFEKSLCDYLASQLERNLILERQQNKLLDEMLGESECAHIMTFNYTYPGSKFNESMISFVHGKWLDKNIIIGVDPANNLSFKNGMTTFRDLGSKELFTKTYRKMILDAKRGKPDKALKKEIDLITFYGHSFGEQDYSYFQSLFDFYSLYDSDIILEFLYSEYDGEPGKKNTKQLEKNLKRIYKLINEYGETLSNKDHGKNLLHKLLLEGRLVIKQI